MALFIVWGCIALTCCTLSYQNIATHGTTQDTADENQTASPPVRIDATANVSAFPGKSRLNGPRGTVETPNTKVDGPK